MKICPYCSKTIVKDALACKHCGEWLVDISDYLEKRGSVYAHTDHISVQSANPSSNQPKEKKRDCIYCKSTKVLTENEKEEKQFICPDCGKKNQITSGDISDIVSSVPIGWGWAILIAYFTISIQKFLSTLDDELQTGITYGLSLIILLGIYFSSRWYLLKLRFEKKKSFGKVYDISAISGVLSTLGVVIFAFGFYFAYPYTGLQTDKKETNNRVLYLRSKINELTEKQKVISEIVSQPPANKKEAGKNASLLDEYINLHNDEKKYADSIYKTLEESSYYTEKIEDKKKIKDASLLVNKIIVYKIMSARNLKHFYLTGDNNALKAVQELNSEISKLNKEYTVKFNDLFIVD